MTGPVNFNPFVKEIKYVDLEKLQEIEDQKLNPQAVIDGDSQDEENVDVRLMSGDTERNYNLAKKSGMNEEVQNNADMLREELEKYIEVYAQNYSRQHPQVSEHEVKNFMQNIDDEFIMRYMNEAEGQKFIAMSDVVQEFDQFASQKMEQLETGRNASRNIVNNERSNSEEKYSDLYQSVTDSQSYFSDYGSAISRREGKEIREDASEYIVNQLLKDNIDLLNQINPYFESYPEYRRAEKLLDTAKEETDPAKAKAAINEAKNLVEKLLEHTSVRKITNIISNNPPQGRDDISSMMLDSASDTKDKYSQLYQTSRQATSFFSRGGSYVTGREEAQIKGKTADLIVSQILNDNGSVGLLKALVPDYRNKQEYRDAVKTLAGIEYETNPAKVGQKLNRAKNDILKLLRHTDGEDIANTVKYFAHLNPLQHTHHSQQDNHDFRWHDSFNDRFSVSKNQKRLFNAAGEIGLPQGAIYNTQDWFGRPRHSAVNNIRHELKDYARDLKLELRYTTRNRNGLNKLYNALDTALKNFDIEEYIKKHGDNISKAEICADFLRSAQGVLANQSRIENQQEEGSDPFNRNLMKSKFLVMTSGRRIDSNEKAEISKSYAQYMIQALMADYGNANQLASVGTKSYFNTETLSSVSLNKCLRDIQDLKQNPPSSRKEFEKQMHNITKELEFLISKMDTKTLARNIMTQGERW